MATGFFDFLLSERLEIAQQTGEHLWLTVVSLMLAVLVALPTGVLVSRKEKLATPVIGFVNIIQTIPSLALLGFLIPLLGIGAVPAITALFLYALLPIVRNTYTGIIGVDKAVKEAACGMGMTDKQMLVRIELPLALPTIFAGIKTAAVINIGVATLCALIGAGGLGEFIFRGISLNNPTMILAGAVPAAVLALIVNALLGATQKGITKMRRQAGKAVLAMFTGLVVVVILLSPRGSGDRYTAGFPSEFIYREDGYAGLRAQYGLSLDVKEMEISLMYDAIKNKDVDVVSGFSTDGRIAAFDLFVLEDDLNYFPPYYAAPLVRTEVLNSYPELAQILNQLANEIDAETMSTWNYRVDNGDFTLRQAAEGLVSGLGLKTGTYYQGGQYDIKVGSKSFTENFILAEVFKVVIENSSSLRVRIQHGFGGTKLIFDALGNGDIDLYAEYTGTGLLVLLPEFQRNADIRYEQQAVYDYVDSTFNDLYDMDWLMPLGFNNTHAIVVRRDMAVGQKIKSISDLAALTSRD